MSEWLDPSGHANYGIGLCDRCHEKFPLDQLFPDPNSPGLRVCLADLDDFDPYRLPARQTENIALQFTRPDESLSTEGLISSGPNASPPVLLALGPSTALSVILTWLLPEGAFPVYYRLYRSVDGGAFTLLADRIGLIPQSYTDNTVDRSLHFYDYYMTYVDIFGGESRNSNIVHVTPSLSVGAMVTLRNIWHTSGSGTMTYNTPGGCDVEIVPTNSNQSCAPIVPVFPKPTTGKYYWEARCSSISSRPNAGASAEAGLAGMINYTSGATDQGVPNLNTIVAYDTYEGGTTGGIYQGDGTTFSVANGAFNVGDVVNVAHDFALNKTWFGKNGVWKGPGTQDPATGQGGFTPSVTNTPPLTGATPHNWWGPWHGADLQTTPETLQYRFSQAFWTFTPPVGFGEFKPWTSGPASLTALPFIDPNGTYDFQNFIPGLAISMLNGTGSGNKQFRSQTQRGAGKRYFEITVFSNFNTGTSPTATEVGIIRASAAANIEMVVGGVAIRGEGQVFQGANHGVYGTTAWYGQTVVAGGIDGRSPINACGGGDTIMVAIDFTAAKAWFGVNGVWLNFQDPTGGAGGIGLGSVATDWIAAFSSDPAVGTSGRWMFNTGGLAFLYKPSGYLGWDE